THLHPPVLYPLSVHDALPILVEGPHAGLAIMDALAARGDLENYHIFHAARAELLRRSGAREEAAKSYACALELVANDSERRYLRSEEHTSELQSRSDLVCRLL